MVFLMLFMLPFYLIYYKYYYRYERYKKYIRELKRRAIHFQRQIRRSVQTASHNQDQITDNIDKKISYEEKYPRMSEPENNLVMQKLHDSWAQAVSQSNTTLDLTSMVGKITLRRNLLFLTLVSAIIGCI